MLTSSANGTYGTICLWLAWLPPRRLFAKPEIDGPGRGAVGGDNQESRIPPLASARRRGHSQRHRLMAARFSLQIGHNWHQMGQIRVFWDKSGSFGTNLGLFKISCQCILALRGGFFSQKAPDLSYLIPVVSDCVLKSWQPCTDSQHWWISRFVAREENKKQNLIECPAFAGVTRWGTDAEGFVWLDAGSIPDFWPWRVEDGFM